ncbi:MAG: YbaK/EbsC family protein [Chloroflexota bacterium]
MSIKTAVTHHLDQLNLPYTLFTHANRVNSLEQAAEERGQRPAQIVRSLVFRLGADSFVMVLMAGPKQIPWKPLRRYLGQSRVTTASKEELKTVTGYEIGAVAPFGLPQPMRILIDESVLAEEDISLGSGQRGTAVMMKTAVLRQALPSAEIVQF